MLSVLLNWIYVILTTFCLGSGFSAFCEKVFGYRFKKIDSILMAGLIIATVYAQFFSLIGGVGLAANLVLIMSCIVIGFFCRTSMKADLQAAWNIHSVGRKVILFCLIFLWAYFSSRGYIHIDTDLYHAQSIRWIEEYGVVKGLGNIHARFAYNSSAFALTALYSMQFLLGQSLHAMSGFFALLLSVLAMDIAKSFKQRRFGLNDYARVAAIYYLTMITDEIVSPASDYFIMCMIFYIVIKWLDLLEEKVNETAPYALLCVACVYALTIKLTAGLILILLARPAYELIKEKKGREICIYIGMGLITAIPWFVRTVLISGWLIYPFPSLDLFQVDWKMHAEEVARDAVQISVWGKAIYDESKLHVSLMEWLPNWFMNTLSGTEKILILVNVLCIPMYLFKVIRMFQKRSQKQADIALVVLAVLSSYLFWQVSAPLLRYGYAYVLLVDSLMLGWIVIGLDKKYLEKAVYFIILAYGVYKLAVISKYIYDMRVWDCYVWQKDYGIYEVVSYEIDGITFYKAASGGLTGYDCFPATPTEAYVELRGDTLADGFRKPQVQ